MDRRPHLRKIERYLFFILLIMIAGYFSWSENVAITRAFKIVSRLGMTLSAFYVHQYILKLGAISAIKLKNKPVLFFYLAYLLLGFASIMWSTDPGYSLLQWFMITESLVFSYYFVKCYLLLDTYFPGHGIKLYRTLGNACFVLLAIFLIGYFVLPDSFLRQVEGGTDFRLGGYLMNPNELGMLAGVGVSSLLFELYHKSNRGSVVLKILVVLVVLILTKSRSSLVGLMAIIYFHIRRSNHTKLKLAVYVLTFASIPVIVENLILRSGGMEDILSMTGRLPFWKALVNEGLPREPWLGFGFMRIDYNDHFESVHTYAGQMTHNTFLQVLMNLGFVGFTIVMFQVFFTVKAFLEQQGQTRLMLLGILIPVMINSMTEFGVFGETNYGILFYQILIITVVLSPPNRLTKRQNLALERRRAKTVKKGFSINV